MRMIRALILVLGLAALEETTALACPIRLACEGVHRTYADDPQVRARLGEPSFDASGMQRTNRTTALERLAPWVGTFVTASEMGPLVPERAVFARARPAFLVPKRTTPDSRRDAFQAHATLFGAPRALKLVPAGADPVVADDITRLLQRSGDPQQPDVFEQVFANGVRCYECRIRISATSDGTVTGFESALASSSDTLVTEPKNTAGEARDAFLRQHVFPMVLSRTSPELRIFRALDGRPRLAWTLVYYFKECGVWATAMAEIDPTTLEWVREVRSPGSTLLPSDGPDPESLPPATGPR